MKRILYLTFYYEPDLCAGSFRNTPLIKELARQTNGQCLIDVLTTVPNRYHSFSVESAYKEQDGNISVTRVKMPLHSSGFLDQINSFSRYFFSVRREASKKKYDMVVASSSRLFTAYLGYLIAKKQQIPLYLDIRDIFVDNMNEILKSSLLKKILLPVLRDIERRTFSYATHINLISEGFKPYFAKYDNANYTYFTNGIDDDFILDPSDPGNYRTQGSPIVITYAGNIGEGQGLHKIVPQLADKLGKQYLFRIIGDGGAVEELRKVIAKLNITNVSLEKPVKRKDLIDIYVNSDFLFIHLNDYDAFKKVLPSKVFEAGAFPRPLLAGVNGYAREFIKKNIGNAIVFFPGNAEELVLQLGKYTYRAGSRPDFIEKFRRDAINNAMASSIRKYFE